MHKSHTFAVFDFNVGCQGVVCGMLRLTANWGDSLEAFLCMRNSCFDRLGSEFFFQFKGNMQLPTVQKGKRKLVTIGEGQVFLLPSRIPHSPQRTDAGSLGQARQISPTTFRPEPFQPLCRSAPLPLANDGRPGARA